MEVIVILIMKLFALKVSGIDLSVFVTLPANCQSNN